MICSQCQNEMVTDCDVTVQGGLYGIKVSKKRKGFLNNVSAKPKAAVCSDCGHVSFYIDEYEDFRE